jgi:DNA modification methylase
VGQLFYGDNLEILRQHITNDSIDLIYLDPPFNSKRGYNLLFKTPKGHESDAQVTAFEDTWHWGEQAEKEFAELLHQSNTDVAEMIQSLRRFLKESDVMAYLTMMANRLLEMRRVLKPQGILIIQVENIAFLPLRLALLVGRLPTVAGIDEIGVDWDRLHSFTPKILAKLLRHKNFEILCFNFSGVFVRIRKIWPSLLAGDIIVKAKKQLQTEMTVTDPRGTCDLLQEISI